jgi:hypothetical protein
MTTRERDPQEQATAPITPIESELATHQVSRDTGDAFLLAADRAIDRALSSDPERFLRQNRQLGGQ